MPDERIENFVVLVAQAPQPSDELVVNGAYPQEVGGSWYLPPTFDEVRAITTGYYKRSLALSPAKVEYDGIPVYGLTTEGDYIKVLGKIDGLGGGFIGVGSALPLAFAEVQGVKHAIITDVNGTLPMVMVPTIGALSVMAPTRAHFISLILGMPIATDQAQELNNLRGEDLIRKMYPARSNRNFTNSFLPNVVDVIKLGHFTYNVHEVLSLLSERDKLMILVAEDSSGLGGLLSSNEAYQGTRMLVMNGQVTGSAIDLATPDVNMVLGALEAMGIPLKVFYVSNVESWLSRGHSGNSVRAERLAQFYENLRSMARVESVVVISSDYGWSRVYDLREYLARGAPVGLTPQETFVYAEFFRSLRYNVMSFRDAGLVETGQDVLDALSIMLRGAEPNFSDLFKSTKDIITSKINNSSGPYEPMDWYDFHDEISKQSAAYRNLPLQVQEMFLLNMSDLGLIRLPSIKLGDLPTIDWNNGGSVFSIGERTIVIEKGVITTLVRNCTGCVKETELLKIINSELETSDEPRVTITARQTAIYFLRRHYLAKDPIRFQHNSSTFFKVSGQALERAILLVSGYHDIAEVNEEDFSGVNFQTRVVELIETAVMRKGCSKGVVEVNTNDIWNAYFDPNPQSIVETYQPPLPSLLAFKVRIGGEISVFEVDPEVLERIVSRDMLQGVVEIALRLDPSQRKIYLHHVELYNLLQAIAPENRDFALSVLPIILADERLSVFLKDGNVISGMLEHAATLPAQMQPEDIALSLRKFVDGKGKEHYEVGKEASPSMGGQEKKGWGEEKLEELVKPWEKKGALEEALRPGKDGKAK